MKSLYLFLFILLVLSSCSSNESTQSFEDVLETDVLIKREVLTKPSGDIITADFNYEGNKLTSSVSSEGYSIDYTYADDLLSGLDISENGVTIISVEILYDAGKLSSYTANFANGLVERFDFAYNSETSILVKRYKGNATSQEFEDDIEVLLNSGNITNVSFPDYSLQYQYDGRNCTYKNIFAIDILNFVGLDFGGFEGIINNPTMRTEIDAGNMETESFVHTYNALGFPETTAVILNGEPYGSIEYFYE